LGYSLLFHINRMCNNGKTNTAKNHGKIHKELLKMIL
jgi:hypothetical protein